MYCTENVKRRKKGFGPLGCDISPTPPPPTKLRHWLYINRAYIQHLISNYYLLHLKINTTIVDFQKYFINYISLKTKYFIIFILILSFTAYA